MSIYASLPKLGPKDIRLLEFSLRDTVSAPDFRCSLIATPLFKAPRYGALSYAWGDAPPIRNINCDGYSLNVTPNLLSALQSIQNLKTLEEYHYLWVDAICIDQLDLQERNAQVSIMKEIYGNAQLVYIWLGEHAGNLDRAMELIMKLNKAAELRLNEPDLNKTEVANKAELPSVESNDAWNDLYRLFFDRPWFERIWTVQELFHARRCLVLNGNITVEWGQLKNIAPLFSDYQYSIPGRWNVHSLLHFSRVKSHQSSNHSRSLMDLLQNFRRQLASDPRDKVYAVLNLSTSPAVSSIPVDYTLTTAEVYRNAARSMIFADIAEERNLDVLCAVHPIQTPQWPSWVPDWSQLLNTLVVFDDDKSKSYATARDTVATASICPNPERLIVKGFRLDVVKVIALPMTLRSGHIPRNSLRSNTVAQHVVANWLSTVLSMESYPTEESLDKVLCETLVAGKGFNDTFPISDNEYLDFYRSYVDLRTQLFSLIRSPRFLMFQSEEQYDDLVFREPSMYISRIETLSYFRRLIITQNGYVGLAPYTTGPDDIICIFLGAQTPFMLRQEDNEWILLGECYVHGMMNSEAFDRPDIEYEDFRIR